MSRGLTSAAQAAAVCETPLYTVAAKLEFPSGDVRINGSPADLIIDGESYVGVGGLGSISAVQETSELRTYDMALGLSGVPADAVSLALTEEFHGAPGTIWAVLLDRTTYQPIADPIVIFRGTVDQMQVELGQTGTVTVTLQDFMSDWERPKIRRWSLEDQQLRDPTDTAFRFLAASTEKQIVWPAGAWWDRQR